MKTLLFIAGLVILVPFGLAVLASTLGDLGMLVGAFGWWGIVIFLIPTAAILAFDALR